MKRTCEITIPFTSEEKAHVAAASKKKGLSMTDFIRGLVLAGGAKPLPGEVLLLYGTDHRTLQLIHDSLSVNHPGQVDANLLAALRVTLRSIEKTTRNLARRLP